MTVRELLTDESKWTQRALARTKDGVDTSPFSRDAVCWCLVAAVVLCNRKNQVSAWIRRTGRRLSEWNDAPGRTFAEVRALILELDL